MSRRWTSKEEKEKRQELESLYVVQNKTIYAISKELGIAYQSVFDRMKRLGIMSTPWRKPGYTPKHLIIIPDYSEKLAEFVGILLGDGHVDINTGQVFIYADLRSEADYISYIRCLAHDLFGLEWNIMKREKYGVCILTTCSIELTSFLQQIKIKESNKVKSQVKIPDWINSRNSYRKGFLRGFFDTDGSIYRLRFGVQLCFKNRSIPLLEGTRSFLGALGYHPSKVSSFSVYLTRRNELTKYAKEIGFHNPKNLNRAKSFLNFSGGSQVVQGCGL